MSDVLLVFARWPEPGQCKTRLIAALGESAAAELHTQLTHRTLAWARRLAADAQLAVEVHFSGGSAVQMSETFGDDLLYVPQCSGDLGAKLTAAFQRERPAPARRIVVVGSDCPQLSATQVATAFEYLSGHQVCIAPAEDGGYVLLGIDISTAPELPRQIFRDIDWGSSHVLEQTLTRLEQSLAARAATCALLPTLADVDTPDDLDVWRRALEETPPAPPRLSVIVPTYHEEPGLCDTIVSAQEAPGSEVIVVAGGRFHHSLRVAAGQHAQCLVSGSDRGARLNLGGARASADTLLFVHADTRLPSGYADSIERLLCDSRNVGGAFQLHIDSSGWPARWVERGVRWRSSWWSLPYGDQALFVRREVFQQLHGFKSQPIMEDYEFVRRLRRRGRVAIAQQSVRTSSRRWQRRGFARTTLMNQCMLLGYHLGVPLERLARFYRGATE